MDTDRSNKTECSPEDQEFLKKAYAFRDKLYTAAVIKLGNEDIAEDSVIDVIMKACNKREQLKDKQKLYPWLLRILINHCNDIIRSRKLEYSDIPVDSIPGTNKYTDDQGQRLATIQEIEQILDLMLSLEPAEYSEVLILYYYRKFDYNLISEKLNIPIGTVKSRLNRGKNILKHIFEKHGIHKEDLRTIRDISKWPEIRLE